MDMTTGKAVYKTELHCHCKNVSLCASVTEEELTNIYTEAGYTTVVLTNHFSPDHYDESWERRVDRVVNAAGRFRNCAAGKIHVILGAEIRLFETRNDYLVYGDGIETMLRDNPNLLEMSLSDFSSCAHSYGLYVAQAHPFRVSMTIANPQYLDGMEVFNANSAADTPFSTRWAERFGLHKQSGSDLHHPTARPAGGILTEEPIITSNQLIKTLKSDGYSLIEGNLTVVSGTSD